MIALLLALVAAGLLVVHYASVALFLRRLKADRPAAPGLIGTPRVTLLRPVCGLGPHDAETLRSSFAQDYPDYEVIFCAASPDDPVLPLLRHLIAEHPQVPARLLVGEARVTRNPKINNVWKGWYSDTSEWVCMTDANLALPPEYLSRVVASWGPATGLGSSPAVGIRPEGLAGRLECAFLNGNQARLQFAADSLGKGYAQGKTLFFNKPLIERFGGLAVLGNALAEDAAATHLMRGLGLRVRLTPLPFAQPVGRRSLTEVWNRQLRWSRIRRDGFPGLFGAEPANGAVLPGLLCLGALAGAGLSPALGLGYLGLWYAAEARLMRRAGWPSGWQDIAVLPLRDLMIPAIWGATFLRRGFDWRGTTMGHPAPVTALHPAE